MIISNEPGYYKTGAYGIRTENPFWWSSSGIGEGKYLRTDTLTFAPIDLRLIDDKLLLPTSATGSMPSTKRVFKAVGPTSPARSRPGSGRRRGRSDQFTLNGSYCSSQL